MSLKEILDQLKVLSDEMATTPPEAQWTMNFSLAEIGINHPEHRQP